jgi:hypothetical protein
MQKYHDMYELFRTTEGKEFYDNSPYITRSIATRAGRECHASSRQRENLLSWTSDKIKGLSNTETLVCKVSGYTICAFWFLPSQNAEYESASETKIRSGVFFFN